MPSKFSFSRGMYFQMTKVNDFDAYNLSSSVIKPEYYACYMTRSFLPNCHFLNRHFMVIKAQSLVLLLGKELHSSFLGLSIGKLRCGMQKIELTWTLYMAIKVK